MVLGYSSSYFTGDYWANTPLWGEKLIPLIDNLLSNNYVYKDQMAGIYYELINKYQNTQDLSYEAMVELIKEQGYSYITDLIKPNAEDLKIIIYLLVLIHMLKGSKKGLELILNIFTLEVEPSDMKIIEWFEQIPVGEENTFKIDSKIDISVISFDFFVNFGKFVRAYLYPELIEFKARYTLNATMGYIPITQVEMKYTSIGTLQM